MIHNNYSQYRGARVKREYRALLESGDFDYLLEADDTVDEDEEDKPKEMTDEKLKVESLKIAINISKLMSDVMVDDVIKIAEAVSDFIKNREIPGNDVDLHDDDEDEDDDDELDDLLGPDK